MQGGVHRMTLRRTVLRRSTVTRRGGGPHDCRCQHAIFVLYKLAGVASPSLHGLATRCCPHPPTPAHPSNRRHAPGRVAPPQGAARQPSLRTGPCLHDPDIEGFRGREALSSCAQARRAFSAAGSPADCRESPGSGTDTSARARGRASVCSRLRYAMSCSRTKHRRSHARPASKALSKARSSMVLSVQLVTCSLHTLPSHRSVVFTMRCSSSLTFATGTV